MFNKLEYLLGGLHTLKESLCDFGYNSVQLYNVLNITSINNVCFLIFYERSEYDHVNP